MHSPSPTVGLQAYADHSNDGVSVRRRRGQTTPMVATPMPPSLTIPRPTVEDDSQPVALAPNIYSWFIVSRTNQEYSVLIRTLVVLFVSLQVGGRGGEGHQAQCPPRTPTGTPCASLPTRCYDPRPWAQAIALYLLYVDLRARSAARHTASSSPQLTLEVTCLEPVPRGSGTAQPSTPTTCACVCGYLACVCGCPSCPFV